MWKSYPETEAALKEVPALDRLRDLFCLWKIWRNLIYPEGYTAPKELVDLVKWSAHATPVLEQFKDQRQDSPSDFALALLTCFYHHDLFVDWQETDTAGLRALLDHELRIRRARLPYRFGRTLYDRFNDPKVLKRTDHLQADEARLLLEDTPPGVFQIGSLLTGPLGLLDSQDSRYLPPSRTLALWHCSDTGCKALHSVKLLPPRIPAINWFDDIKNHLTESIGPASEWHSSLRDLARDKAGTEGRLYYDLPVILAEAIVGDERTTLLARALRGPNGDTLRKTLERSPRKKTDGLGTPEEMVTHYSPEEQHQLLLVLSDEHLVQLLDDAIIDDAIKVPIGECRTTKVRPPHAHHEDRPSAISSLGIRSYRKPAPANLVAEILSAYKEENQLTELH